MNKFVSHLSAAAAGVAVAYFATYTLMRWEIDSLRAAVLRSAAREAEQAQQLATALDFGSRVDSYNWQSGMAYTSCSAARTASEELLRLAQKHKEQPVKPAPVIRRIQPAPPQESPVPAPVKPASPAIEVKPQAVAGTVDAGKMLAAHNRLRAEVGISDLHWSDKLAKVAQKYAESMVAGGCVLPMQHSGIGYGENLYWASAEMWADGRREYRPVPPNRPVDAWGEEKKWYNVETGQCAATGKDTCGHYTQVVDKGTQDVGCGMAVCGNKAQIWVCNYFPAGDVAGQKPF